MNGGNGISSRLAAHAIIFALMAATGAMSSIMTSIMTSARAQPLKTNPTPQDYVERNGGGATIVPAGQLTLDGRRMSCGRWPTILDPNLNDYAAAPYPQFMIVNMPLVAKVPTAVKLWIFSHECEHLLGVPEETKADCLAVHRGRSEKWLDAQGLDQVCDFIKVARPDATHPSGPDRCLLMRECFRQNASPLPAKPAPQSPAR